MKNQTSRTIFLAAMSAAMLLGSYAVAQNPPAAPAPAGLDALDEHDVYINLINHKLTDLAQADMDAHKVPKAEQDQMFSLAALETLKNSPNLTAAQRRALAVKAASGLKLVMATTTDADKLTANANDLVRYGINQTVDELDYFGETADVQTQLQPVALTAKELYAKASDGLNNQLNVMQAKLSNSNAAVLMPQLNALGNKQSLIDYSNNMTSYALCISYPVGNPKRKEIADAAIKYLTDLDNADQGVQPDVKVAMGKLNLAKRDFDATKKMFDPVIAVAGVVPAPSLLQQNTARYFSIQAELDANAFDKAETDATALDAWQKNSLAQQFAADPGTANAVAASMGMLHYRIASAHADASPAGSPVAKKYNDQAVTALVTLLNSQRNNTTLQDLVFDQIRGRIGPNPDYKTLDTLALLALQSQGFSDYEARDTKPIDPAVMEKAIAASQQLIARVGQPGVDKAKAEQSARFVAYAYQFGLKKDVEAANAYMDYLTAFPADPKTSVNADGVVNNLKSVMFEFKKKQESKSTTAEEDDTINAIFDKFYPLMLNPPFSQVQLAGLYGDSLYSKQKWADAAKYLGMVPADSPTYATSSFKRMVSLAKALNDPAAKIEPDQRKAIVADTVKAAGVVQKVSAEAAKKPGVNPGDSQVYLIRAVTAAQVAASLDRSELKDPKAALVAIDEMEKLSADVTDPARQKEIQVNVLKMRCSNYLAANETGKAVDAVQALLKVDAVAGQALVVDVNAEVEKDLVTATANKDAAQIKNLTIARAALTGEIVNFVSASKDPKTLANLPGFRLYDAQSKLAAAELEDDGPGKTDHLNGALSEYNVILADYQKSGDAAKLEQVNEQVRKAGKKVPPELQAQQDALQASSNNNEKAAIGAGLVSFDLGDYQKTVDLIKPLIIARHIGTPTEPVIENGVKSEREIPQYWQTFYKYYQAEVKLGQNGKPDLLADAKMKVANEYTLNAKRFGGTVWKDQCMALLKQVKPDAVK